MAGRASYHSSEPGLQQSYDIDMMDASWWGAGPLSIFQCGQSFPYHQNMSRMQLLMFETQRVVRQIAML